MELINICLGLILFFTLRFKYEADATQLRGPRRGPNYRELQSEGLVIDVGGSSSNTNDTTQKEQITSISRAFTAAKTLEIQTGGPFIGPEVSVNQSNNQSSEITEDRIVGGYDADPHPFYAMLLVPYGGGWRWAGCGATLISNCHVVTAAHCTMDSSIDIGAVFVNAYRPYNDNDGVPFHFSEISNIVPHSAFNSTTNENDIAIIKMANCLNISTFPPAIPASPATDISSGLMVDILGFGKLSEKQSLFSNVQSLQIAQIPVISNQDCKEYYGNKIKGDMLCGGYGNQGGVDACQGDSGGSMVHVRADGQATLLGVISWGVGCGRAFSPGVYSSIPFHFGWVYEHVCNDPDTDKYLSWCHSNTLSADASVSASNASSTKSLAQPSLAGMSSPSESPRQIHPTADSSSGQTIANATGQPTLTSAQPAIPESTLNSPSQFTTHSSSEPTHHSTVQPSHVPSSVPSVSHMEMTQPTKTAKDRFYSTMNMEQVQILLPRNETSFSANATNDTTDDFLGQPKASKTAISSTRMADPSTTDSVCKANGRPCEIDRDCCGGMCRPHPDENNDSRSCITRKFPIEQKNRARGFRANKKRRGG